jgi:ribosomal protein L11 methyltransferase
MKRGTIWEIAIRTTAESEDAVSELLSTIVGKTACVCATDPEGRASTVSIYLDRQPSNLLALRTALHAGMSRIKRFGLDAGAGRVLVRRVRHQDWAQSWKRHFKPFEIGKSLLIKPSWSRRQARKNQSVVVLDPGLSFGTGQHPTTAFCLRELAKRAGAARTQSFLDIGTGSGVLAIAAAKLGYSPVHAFDLDPEAVRAARANARVNGLARKINIKRTDLTKLPSQPTRRYDLVCANLISTLLVAERQGVARLLHPGGTLLLSGVLRSEFFELQTAYRAVGLRLLGSRLEEGWRSGVFVNAAAG